MALFEILRFYRNYHDRRIAEAKPQRELLKDELKLIGAALLAIIALAAGLIGLAIYFR